MVGDDCWGIPSMDTTTSKLRQVPVGTVYKLESAEASGTQQDGGWIQMTLRTLVVDRIS